VYAWTGSAYESNPSQTTLYYYNGWNLIYEATYTGIIYSGSTPNSATFDSEIAYQWGLDWSTSMQGAGGVGGLVAIAFRDAGGVAGIRYPGFDGNGNLVVLLDESGSLTATYEYGPYGELWRASGPDAARNPFRFSTKYHDAATKLYYYGYRYYSPDYGRFISQDPIRETGGLNIYAFVNNNPTNHYDYLGMFSNLGLAAGFAAGYADSFDFGSSSSDFSYTYSNPFAYDPFDPFSYQSSFLTTFDIYGHNYAPVRAPEMPSFGLLPTDYYPGSFGNNYDWLWNSNSYSDYGGGFDASTRTEFNSDRSISTIVGEYPIATVPLSGDSDYQYFEHLTMRQNGVTPIGGEPDNYALMAGLGGLGRAGYATWQTLSVGTKFVTGTSFTWGQIIAEPDQPLNYVGVGPLDEAFDALRIGSKSDDIALGLTRGRDGKPLLQPFADDVGAVGNHDWVARGLADESPFVQRFYQAGYRSTSNGGRIKFNLDDLNLNRALDTPRFSDPFDVGVTNWELQQILNNRQFYDATDFFIGSEKLGAQDVIDFGLGFGGF